MLKGKKSYLLAIAGLIYAAAGYFTGQLDAATAVDAAQTALTGAFLRAGVSNVLGGKA